MNYNNLRIVGKSFSPFFLREWLFSSKGEKRKFSKFQRNFPLFFQRHFGWDFFELFGDFWRFLVIFGDFW